MLRYHQKVIPSVLLLTPSPSATGIYEDDIFTFRYRVIRLWEEQSINFMDDLRLYPFLPLMKGDRNVLEEAETRIYNNTEINLETKADLLTAMAIFAGIKDRELTTWLIERRRDIMIQSVAYEIIKEEGIKEGIREGRLEGLRDAISLGLEIKFGTDGLILYEEVQKIEAIEKLELIKEAIKIAEKIEEIEKLL